MRMTGAPKCHFLWHKLLYRESKQLDLRNQGWFMNIRSNLINRSVASLLSSIVALSVMPHQVTADVKSKVQIQIGKPSVWSLAQAHYLLAKMHQDNRGLATHMPSPNDLDPNAINSTRIQLLRTLLDIEGQYSQET